MGNEHSIRRPRDYDGGSSATSSSTNTNDRRSVSNANFTWMDADGTMRWKDDAQALLKTVTSNKEKVRIAQQHSILNILMLGNFKAPLHDLLAAGGANVLEIGCGEGTWTLENALDYPSSTFQGIDINAELFPTSRPTNVTFTQANVINGIPCNNEAFDFVFCRSMFTCFTKDEWPPLVNEILRVCKYGGYIEFVEPSMDIFNAGPSMAIWNRLYALTIPFLLLLLKGRHLMESQRLDILISYHIRDLIDRSSEVNVITSDYVSVPLGWSGAVGELMMAGIRAYVFGFKQPLMPMLNMTSAQYDEFAKRCFEECPLNESFLNYYYTVAQKTALA